jgi:4-amino-4-deoxy-L-arabinose transferase-like glycosyltransferase
MKKKFKKRLYIFLLAIVLLGAFLRFWQLADYPVHLTIDEVAVGYNAFSLLKTARDEHGVFLPLAFESTGDWKPPVLFYLTVPSILVFGMSEFGVRFPLALTGSLIPWLAFLIIRRLTKNDLLGLFTSFSLAISPWLIHFSRISHDSVLGLFFVLLGVWLFLKAIEEKEKLLPLSAFSFVLSMYSCHAERIFTPLLVLGLALIYRQKIWLKKKQSFFAFLLGFLLLLPLGLLMTGPQGQRRAQMTFLSQDIEISKDLHQAGERLSLVENILDNNFLILGNFWLKRYLNYWDPNFLFFKGMKLSLPGAPDIGLFHLFEFPLFLLGLGLLFFKKGIFNKKTKMVIIIWLLLGPLAASFANNDQHASRSLTTIPMPQLMVALGLFYLIKKFVQKNFKRIVIFCSLLSGVVLFSLFYYFDLYYLHYPVQFSEYFDYGYKELSLYAWEHHEEYQEIIVDYNFGKLGPYITGVPHLYALFYGQYDPNLYQKRSDPQSNNFANFTFRPIYWPEDRNKKQTLFMGSPWSLPPQDLREEQILKKVYFKNGELGFLVVKSED